MKILVVGNGGREHAIAWKLQQSEGVERIICVPGNGGTATLNKCQNLPLRIDDFQAIAQAVIEQEISLVVVGPELPLSLGITDYLHKHTQVNVFGPTKLGSQIEASKSWCKALMQTAGIPTASGATFTNPRDAKSYISAQGAPIVVKADGLAAGKGVTVAMTIAEAQAAVDALFQEDSNRVVIEAYLEGEEVSILALTDGKTIRPLLPAQDHKRIGAGDTGSNTGGMGAYAPAPLVDTSLIQKIQQQVLEPTLRALQERQIDYRGVLYAGLMITPQQEIKVLEFNCRFGDPETQAILPLLETPLDELLLACATGKLEQLPPLQWRQEASICVVIASGGYPGNYEQQKAIVGIAEAEQLGVTVFHAGTKYEEGQLVTAGGRVLNVTATATNFEEAIKKVYQGVDCIDFANKYCRRDIGYRLFV
ncbi:phosphoribosylamine--glycine ligase [Gloeocapsa sp. PCC 73106]|uniref:phosphoribosylamine--glycine ligase n=1 Tax=Gloeocapsa sp. PCC 73106 TaxID=102232 RepID=UPI0002ABB235|nr:phosphoribosylamine--glycine ligase [Gloeocapsa sp. PCC 73106]ELR98510.1 phosphoribosylamine--glycine ligase [Gloeocapsa sp. PCC 73106]